MNKLLRVSIITALAISATTPAFALSINPLVSDSNTGTALTTAWLGVSSGISVVGPVSYVGATNQAGTYTGFALNSSSSTSPNVTFGDGILLTSGNANILDTNTEDDFGVVTSTGSSTTISTITGLTTNDANSWTSQNIIDVY